MEANSKKKVDNKSGTTDERRNGILSDAIIVPSDDETETSHCHYCSTHGAFQCPRHLWIAPDRLSLLLLPLYSRMHLHLGLATQ